MYLHVVGPRGDVNDRDRSAIAFLSAVARGALEEGPGRGSANDERVSQS